MKTSFFKPYRYPLLLVILFWSTFTLKAQVEPNHSPEKYDRKAFITDFQQAVLLVRLQDRQLSIEKLEAKGLHEEAEQIRAAQRRENRETILSFGKTFDFCPVYFFYAKDSEAIRRGDYLNKVFDANFNLVTLSPDQKVFTAEFSETDALGIDGLIIMDHQLLSFKEPLPYFERRYVFFGLVERSKAQMVEAYNDKLHDYAEGYRKS